MSARKKKKRRGPAAAAKPRPEVPARSHRLRLPPALEGLVSRIPAVRRRALSRHTRQDLLTSSPVRNPEIEWELIEEAEAAGAPPVVVLRIPRRQDRWGRLLNRIFEAPSHREVILDELGTDVWQLCDGEHTVEALIQALAAKYKLERREVELSLAQYLGTLVRRGFLALMVDG